MSSPTPSCQIDRDILNHKSIEDMDDIALSFFASACGKNRGAFVLDPPDGNTYGCADAIPLECGQTIEMVNGKDRRTVCDKYSNRYQRGGDNRFAGTEPQFLSDAQKICGGGVFYVMSEVLLPRNTLPDGH